MEIIYEPSGGAKEYAPLAVNLYKGCDHRCIYCFGPSTLRKEREIFHTKNQPKKDALTKFAKDAEKLNAAGDDREILLRNQETIFDSLLQTVYVNRLSEILVGVTSFLFISKCSGSIL